MKPADIVRWTLEWNKPYTNPPDDGPRVLVEQILPRGERPEEVYKLFTLGSPYGIHFRTISTKQPRQLSIEAKQGIRRKAMVRRIQKAAPLFATSLIEETMNKQPEYFGTKE